MNMGVRHHLGHGQFPTTSFTNVLLVYQTHELTQPPQPGNHLDDHSSAKSAYPLKPQSPSVCPSQQTTGPRCDLTDNEAQHIETLNPYNLIA